MNFLIDDDDDVDVDDDDMENIETAEMEDDIDEKDAYVEESRKITEGLRSNDLSGVVSPIIEIDTFESKISEDGLVVMFLADDEAPGQDLCDFIEKTAIEILDCEVSFAPNEKGQFAVFIEFVRNGKFSENMMELMDAVDSLVDIEMKEWKIKAYKKKGTHELTERNLNKLVRLKPHSGLPTKE